MKNSKKMIFMTGMNNINKWKKLYIFGAYTLPHIRYGANKFYTTSGSIYKLNKNTQYQKLLA